MPCGGRAPRRRTAGSADNPDLKALSDKVAALEQLGANGSADTGAVTSLTQRLATLEAALKAATAAASTNEGRIAGLEKNLQSVEQGVGDLSGKVSAQAGQPKAALAIAVAGLKAALEQGGPFTAEVETFAAVVPDAPDLAGLRAVAAAGNRQPAGACLQAPEVAGAMIDAGQPVPDDAGLVSRFLASAKSLVKVRPVGPVAGNGVPERVSRWRRRSGRATSPPRSANIKRFPMGPKRQVSVHGQGSGPPQSRAACRQAVGRSAQGLTAGTS